MPLPLWLPSAISGASSALGAWMQNRSQQGSADKQMQFQQQMSDTAYQRATADMRASGINPMLAYMQGGASSPGGASAQMSDVIGPAVASAQHQRRLSAELKLLKTQEDLVAKQRDTAFEQGMLTQSERNHFDRTAHYRDMRVIAEGEAARAGLPRQKLFGEFWDIPRRVGEGVRSLWSPFNWSPQLGGLESSSAKDRLRGRTERELRRPQHGKP